MSDRGQQDMRCGRNKCSNLNPPTTKVLAGSLSLKYNHSQSTMHGDLLSSHECKIIVLQGNFLRISLKSGLPLKQT
jgi:hypothetical protein